jgi:type III pantothenate kinase
MILELDCGNSWIKWRVLNSAGCEVLFAGAVAGSQQLIEALLELPGLSLLRCRLASVRSASITRQLVDLISSNFAVEPVVARSLPRWAGVRNGYCEPGKLGVDRWLAILAAFNRAAGACLVIDVGTAVTVDFVTVNGEHLGGYICPGLRLMSEQLVAHAQGIAGLHVGAGSLQDLTPGRTTDQAVARGAVLMLRGFVESQLQLAPALLGESFTLFLTGGDAELVGALSVEAHIVSDLVFVGLAIACP